MTEARIDDPTKVRALTAIDLLLTDFKVCSSQKNEHCGCPVLGFLDASGQTRFVALDPKSCEDLLKLLNRIAPTMGHFWEKRIELQTSPPGPDGSTRRNDQETDGRQTEAVGQRKTQA